MGFVSSHPLKPSSLPHSPMRHDWSAANRSRAKSHRGRACLALTYAPPLSASRSPECTQIWASACENLELATTKLSAKLLLRPNRAAWSECQATQRKFPAMGSGPMCRPCTWGEWMSGTEAVVKAHVPVTEPMLWSPYAPISGWPPIDRAVHRHGMRILSVREVSRRSLAVKLWGR